jgi:DNA-binding beta-propeller fold protein YncE
VNRPSSRAWPLLLLLACATPRRSAPPAISYPAAPERARLVYRGELRSDRDVVVPGFWRRLTSALVGERAPEQFQAPFGVGFDPSGRLLVTDTGRHAVLVLDRERGRYQEVAPKGEDALGLPLGVDADAAGRIYVADGVRGVVRVFSADGAPIARIDAGGALRRPTGVAVDRARGLLYVADTPEHVIRVLGLDGTPLREIGGHGGSPGQLNFPTFVAVDGKGRLVVNDSMNFRVQIFDPEGRLVSVFGKLGNGSGDMSRSKGVAVDGRGHVYVADALFGNFQIFDDRGRLLLFVGERGRAAGQFRMPAGLAIHGTTVAVADGERRVQLFEIVVEDDLPEAEGSR